MAALRLSGGAMVFLGAFFWSLCSPIVKYLPLDPFLILGLRSLVAAAVLAPFIRPKQLRWNRWMLLYLASYAALTVSILQALKLTSSPVAVGMQYTSLIWLFLAELVLTRKFNAKTFAPACVILVGVVLFMTSGTDGGTRLGNLIALTEGVSFACMTVSSRKAAGENPLGLTAIAAFFTFLLMMAFLPGKMAGAADMTGMQWLLIFVQGAVQVGAGYAFYNLGLQRVSAQKAAVIALWEMVLGPLWVALFLREYPTVPVLLGLLVVMGGILLDTKLNRNPM